MFATFSRMSQISRRASLLLLLAVCTQSVHAQRVTADLPDAPLPNQQSNTTQQKPGNRFGSTVGVIGRRSLFFPELAVREKPLSATEKFKLAIDQSIAPSRFFVSAAVAGIEQADNSWPGYGQGGEGYGKRFGAVLALNASDDMFGTFLFPAIARHDPRYFVTEGGFGRKVGHALRRVLLTRTDSGGEAPNWSGLLGTLGASGLANTYLPDAERTTGKTFERFGIHVGVVAGSNVLKEFWPVIFKSLGGSRSARQSDLKDSPVKP